MNDRIPLILVTGATGYLGGRLVPRLLQADYSVRVLARDARRLSGRPWLDQIEVVQGDVLQPETLPAAMEGVHAAYYLIHSMRGNGNFHERDLAAARHFGEAARAAGVQRIIYLGGLGDSDADLSHHLQSRQETGRVLADSGVAVTEFRSAIIVGSGSVSFEMIRNLAERLPVMICPRWIYTRVQPIGIRNVLDYLVAALNTPASAGRVIEIGGADVLTYGEMMLQYAEARGLRRWLVPVPVLTPRLSSHWVHWVTPVPVEIAQPLIEGLRNEVIVRDDSAHQLFPSIRPMDYRTAVARALVRLDAGGVETAWSDALASSRGDAPSVQLKVQEGMIIEKRQMPVAQSAEKVFAAFTRLGGERGWLYWNWAWRLRGVIDRMVGGVGFRRGRRHPTEVRVGDALDFWRVEGVEPGRLLRLRAEMRVPGRAWLQFEVTPETEDRSLLTQTAFFAPKGLSGLLYWYVLYPVHAFIFSGMIRAVTKSSLSPGG
ncbi:MAG: SDR family oxidoreductase [Caldilineales bacterium]|nr:SDR family oxidoreductase [Caldilineales bacterium]